MPCWPFKSNTQKTSFDVSNGAFQSKSVTYDGPGGDAKKDEDPTQLKKLFDNSEAARIKVEEQCKKLRKQLEANEKKLAEFQSKLKDKDGEINHLKELLRSIQPRPENASGATKERRRRSNIRGTMKAPSGKARKYNKTPAQRKFLRKAILDNDFLGNLDLTDKQINELIDYARNNPPVADGTMIIEEGTNGNELYILESGVLEVLQKTTVLNKIERGAVFGEIAILYDRKRTATVTARTQARIWTLERSVYNEVMRRTATEERGNIERALRNVDFLNNIGKQKLGKIIDVLEKDTFQKGDYIARQGESGETFYIILSGQVRVTMLEQLDYDPDVVQEKTEPAEQFVRFLNPGDYFGERALRSDSGLRGANVIAEADQVTCATLDKETFNMLIGDLADKEYESPQLELEQRKMSTTLKGLTVGSFERLGVLGTGGFGRVELVRLRSNAKRTFALKCLKKANIVEMEQQERIFCEKMIMRDANSSFICQLFTTFKDDWYVYMLMEACLGGELWTRLRDDGSFKDSRAKFYAACVIEAIEYLHLRGIVYRDLKPENLLLDERGYIKLVDFGFAKKMNFGEKTWTFCGTPEYVAPEVILNKGHDIAVDYWSLGILIFEMLTGNPPFTSSDPLKTYRMIIRGIDAVQWPFAIKDSSKNLIRRLCRTNPADRLGNMREGIQQIRKHRWFNGFHWESLKKGEAKAPFLPEIMDASDMRNFDKFDKPDEEAEKEMSGWDADF